MEGVLHCCSNLAVLIVQKCPRGMDGTLLYIRDRIGYRDLICVEEEEEEEENSGS